MTHKELEKHIVKIISYVVCGRCGAPSEVCVTHRQRCYNMYRQQARLITCKMNKLGVLNGVVFTDRVPNK